MSWWSWLVVLTFKQFAELAAGRVGQVKAWRIAATLAAIIVIFIAVNLLTLAFGLPADQLEKALNATPATSQTTLILLVPFGGILALTLLFVIFFHRRPLGLVFALKPAGFWVKFVMGLLALGLFAGAGYLMTPEGPALEQQFPPMSWLGLAALGLGLLTIQTLTEEVIFRGYLQTYLAAWSASPLVWWLLPSFLFGAVHYGAVAEPKAALVIVAAATITGLFLADVTARTGSIAAAWGIHLGNNAVSVLLVAIPGPLSGIALYRYRIDAAGDAALLPILILSTVQIAAVYLLYFCWIQWRLIRAKRLQIASGASI